MVPLCLVLAFQGFFTQNSALIRESSPLGAVQVCVAEGCDLGVDVIFPSSFFLASQVLSLFVEGLVPSTVWREKK